MEIELIKTNLKKLLGESNLSDCIDLFKSLLNDSSSIREEIILIESEYNRVGRKERTGTLSTDEIGLSNRKTSDGILNLINKIQQVDVNIYNEWKKPGEEVQIKLLIDENKKLRTDLDNQKSLLQKFKELSIHSIVPAELANFSITDYWNSSINQNWRTIFANHFPPGKEKATFADIKRWLFSLRELKVKSYSIKNLDPIRVLKELETLEISNCGSLNNIDAISQLTNLTNLKIAHSNIPSLKPVGAQKNLKILKISYIKSQGLDLADISLLANLVALEIDQLDNGSIYNFEALGEIKSLKYLRMKRNLASNSILKLIEKKVKT